MFDVNLFLLSRVPWMRHISETNIHLSNILTQDEIIVT
jgi:hypothetical protein